MQWLSAREGRRGVVGRTTPGAVAGGSRSIPVGTEVEQAAAHALTDHKMTPAGGGPVWKTADLAIDACPCRSEF